QHEANRLEVANRLVKRLPLSRIRESLVQARLGYAHRLRSDPETPAVERFHGDLKALPFNSVQAPFGHARVGEAELNGAGSPNAHGLFFGANRQAGGVALDQQAADASVLVALAG